MKECCTCPDCDGKGNGGARMNPITLTEFLDRLEACATMMDRSSDEHEWVVNAYRLRCLVDDFADEIREQYEPRKLRRQREVGT